MKIYPIFMIDLINRPLKPLNSSKQCYNIIDIFKIICGEKIINE
ncbi:hypothetical protein [Clostridium tetani]|nr:hypothetical protein [Clostridium tetani]BDR67127.1 hypothetical protein K144312032_13550 [Clostridium tetani]CDI49524.1 hypothetical protein BN906_01526 [Clostridium tetani 12124569]